MSIIGAAEEAAATAVAGPAGGIVVKVWRGVKPALPYIAALGAVALALLLWRAPWAESRQKATDYDHFQPVIDKSLARVKQAADALATAGTSIRTLRQGIDRQNAATLALAKAEQAKLADAQAALAAARANDARRDATIAKLTASAAAPIPGQRCEASAAAKETWK